MTNHIVTTDRDGIRVVAMQRPEKKNALTQGMYRAMADALVTANEDKAVRCVVFSGAPGAFSAGNDLEDFLKAVESGAGISAAVAFLHALARCDKPLVAAVDGLAVGIGTTMLFHCDQVVASPASRFLTPFTQLGLVPEGGSSLLAPRLIGHQRAFSLLVMGRTMSATAAHEAGLVNTLADDVEAEAMKTAGEIASLPPEAVRLSRNLLLSRDETIRRIDEEAAIFAQRMRSPEAIGAFKAFLSRKK
jgi:enoyl-CoA hydratase/carnithine racemase